VADPTHRDPTKRYSRAHSSSVTAEGKLVLPAHNDLEPPDAPPGVALTDDELIAWAAYWRSPSSTRWTDESVYVVAALVKVQGRIIAGDATSADHATLAKLLDGLGLTPTARLRLGWEVADDE
jgi:hypothetical protein